MKSSPLDKNQNRKAPFATPEGYFEELPARVQQRIAASTPEKAPWVFSSRWVYYGLGVAAMLIVSIWLAIDPPVSTDPPISAVSWEQQLAQVPEETLIDYLEESDIDVMAVAPLTESEQQLLLEQELNLYSVTEEFINETSDDYLEDAL